MKIAKHDRYFYAVQIPDSWEQMVAATRTFGYTLVSSRIDLPPQDWRELVTDDLPFDLAVACRTLKFAQTQQIPGVIESPGQICFYEIIHLEEPAFRYGLDHGLVSATCSPTELAVLKKQFKAAAHI
jgi:hypothetical protein